MTVCLVGDADCTVVSRNVLAMTMGVIVVETANPMTHMAAGHMSYLGLPAHRDSLINMLKYSDSEVQLLSLCERRAERGRSITSNFSIPAQPYGDLCR